VTLARPVGTHRVQPLWSSAFVWCDFVFARCFGSCTRVCALVAQAGMPANVSFAYSSGAGICPGVIRAASDSDYVRHGLFYKGECQEKHFSHDRKEKRFPGLPAPVHWATHSAVIRVSPLRLSALLICDDANRVAKLSKLSGCTVSTMVLSEARGLRLFRVIRGGIGLSQRLDAGGIVSTGHTHTRPRTRASLRTGWPSSRRSARGRGSRQKRSSCLLF
jgi:hypothetical protein